MCYKGSVLHAACLLFAFSMPAIGNEMANDAPPKMVCVNPQTSEILFEPPIHSGQLLISKSPKLQFNVNIEPGAGSNVVYLTKGNNGICNTSVDSDYNIILLTVDFDKTDVWTRDQPINDVILDYIRYELITPLPSNLVRVDVKYTYEDHQTAFRYAGVVNAYFTATYAKK